MRIERRDEGGRGKEEVRIRKMRRLKNEKEARKEEERKERPEGR